MSGDPLKVLYCSFDVIPEPTGSSARATEFLRGLCAFNVDGLTAKSPDHPHIEHYQGARLMRVPVGNGDLPVRVQAFERAVRRQIESDEYHLVHFTDPYGGYALCEMREQHNFKLVYEVAGFPSIELKYTHPHLDGDRRFLAKLRRQELFCLMNADAVLVGSEVTAATVQGLGVSRERIRMVPTCVELAPYDDAQLPRPDRSPMRALYLGSQCGWQGLLTAVAAVGLASAESDVRLSIVGPQHPSFRLRLEEAIKLRGLGEKVELLPSVAPDSLPKLLAAADLGIAPLDACERNVGQGAPVAKISHYLAAGRPVIASNLPMVREVTSPECALLHEPGDERGLASLLIELAKDPARRCAMGEAGRALARARLGAERARNELVKLYASLLSDSGVEIPLPDEAARPPEFSDAATCIGTLGQGIPEAPHADETLTIAPREGVGSTDSGRRLKPLPQLAGSFSEAFTAPGLPQSHAGLVFFDAPAGAPALTDPEAAPFAPEPPAEPDGTQASGEACVEEKTSEAPPSEPERSADALGVAQLPDAEPRPVDSLMDSRDSAAPQPTEPGPSPEPQGVDAAADALWPPPEPSPEPQGVDAAADALWPPPEPSPEPQGVNAAPDALWPPPEPRPSAEAPLWSELTPIFGVPEAEPSPAGTSTVDEAPLWSELTPVVAPPDGETPARDEPTATASAAAAIAPGDQARIPFADPADAEFLPDVKPPSGRPDAVPAASFPLVEPPVVRSLDDLAQELAAEVRLANSAGSGREAPLLDGSLLSNERESRPSATLDVTPAVAPMPLPWEAILGAGPRLPAPAAVLESPRPASQPWADRSRSPAEALRPPTLTANSPLTPPPPAARAQKPAAQPGPANSLPAIVRMPGSAVMHPGTPPTLGIPPPPLPPPAIGMRRDPAATSSGEDPFEAHFPEIEANEVAPGRLPRGASPRPVPPVVRPPAGPVGLPPIVVSSGNGRGPAGLPCRAGAAAGPAAAPVLERHSSARPLPAGQPVPAAFSAGGPTSGTPAATPAGLPTNAVAATPPAARPLSPDSGSPSSDEWLGHLLFGYAPFRVPLSRRALTGEFQVTPIPRR